MTLHVPLRQNVEEKRQGVTLFPYLSTLLPESAQSIIYLHCCRNPPSLQKSPLGIRPIEKYNTKHIQPKPFSATLPSAGTLPELEGQLLSVLAARHAPSMSLKSAQVTTQLHSLVQDINKERLVFIRELEIFKYPTVQIIL